MICVSLVKKVLLGIAQGAEFEAEALLRTRIQMRVPGVAESLKGTLQLSINTPA